MSKVSPQLKLARRFIAACRARKRSEPTTVDLLEGIAAAIRRLPEDQRGIALDLLQHHLAEAFESIDGLHHRRRHSAIAHRRIVSAPGAAIKVTELELTRAVSTNLTTGAAAIPPTSQTDRPT